MQSRVRLWLIAETSETTNNASAPAQTVRQRARKMFEDDPLARSLARSSSFFVEMVSAACISISMAFRPTLRTLPLSDRPTLEKQEKWASSFSRSSGQ